MRTVDIHAHVIPSALKTMAEDGTLKNVTFQGDSIVFDGTARHPCTPLFCSGEARLAWMGEHRVDCMAVSVTPRLFFYELPAELGARAAQQFNDELLDLERKYPGRQIAVGTLPLQDPVLGVRELRRLAQNGVRLVQIGTSVNGRALSAPELEPFWSAAEELRVAVMLHPLITREFPLMGDYHLANLVGNPWQTTAAAADLIFSGVFQRYPGLRVLLVHGGGFLPYQLGRLRHGYQVRRECRGIGRDPEEFFHKNLWFDGLTHSRESLGFLLKTAGRGKVLLGSDYPYDMAEYDQRQKMEALGCSPEEILEVCGQNALEFLGG